MQTDVNWVYWYAEGGGRTRSPLYGIWNVQELSVDGQSRPAALNDYDRRWRRVIFDSPESLTFQRTDDSFARYGVSVDAYAEDTRSHKGTKQKLEIGFHLPAPGGRNNLFSMVRWMAIASTCSLQLAEFDTFRLLNSDFRWVRPSD